MANAGKTQGFELDVLQWISVQLRIAALEHSGVGLSYRFILAADVSSVTCNVYFSEQAGNPIGGLSTSEQRELHEGWIDLGMQYIKDAIAACELPPGFSLAWKVRSILHFSDGMGSRIVQESTRSLKWEQPSAQRTKRKARS
jgi:hypothetical protein